MKILVTLPLTEQERAELEGIAPDATYVYCDENVSDEEIASAQVILGNLPPERMSIAEKLEWLHLNSAGADVYTKAGVFSHAISLTNSTGAYGLAISEHLLAQTFFLKKKLGLYHRNQMSGVWKDEGEVTAIEGSTTLVIGLGNIGGDYARKMALLGSKVYGIRRNITACPPMLQAVGTFDDLDAWLPQADIVALALPNTPQTYHLMNAARFAQMKKGSILLNVGRGTSVDTDALYQALQTGPLEAAAVDVTDPEPLPQGHPLWSCENFLLTPHVSGDYHLRETRDYIMGLAIENFRRYVNGTELKNQVDFSTGYRKFSE